MNEVPICPICEKRRREKGRVKPDGTVWYRATCRMCRNKKKKLDEKKDDNELLTEIKRLRRYKKAMKVLCDRQCVDIEDVLRKYAPEDPQSS